MLSVTGTNIDIIMYLKFSCEIEQLFFLLYDCMSFVRLLIIRFKMKKIVFLLLSLVETFNDCSDPTENEDFLVCQVKNVFSFLRL